MTVYKKSATIFSLGNETFINRKGPAASSHSGKFKIVKPLLNCRENIYTLKEEEDSYIFNKCENSITILHKKHCIVVLDPTKIACYAILGKEDFDFSYDYGYMRKKPRLLWLFPGKPAWVTLGNKKSFALLEKNKINPSISEMEEELEKATVKAPQNTPFLAGQNNSWGTT